MFTRTKTNPGQFVPCKQDFLKAGKSIELWMLAGSWESTRESFEFVECFPSFSSALPTVLSVFRDLSRFACIVYSKHDANRRSGPF